MASNIASHPKVGSANTHETESVSGALRSAANDIKDQITPFGSDFFKQLLGLEEKTASAHKKGEVVDMKPGEAIDFKALKKQKSAETMHNPNILPGIDYRREIVHGSETINAKEKNEIAQTINEIKNELQRLVSSSALLQEEFKGVYMNQAPATPGKYHQNFFEWVLIVLKQARMKVEDSGAWIQAMKGKGKKGKADYWGMFKKHGTTFGQSNERSVATQTG